MLIQASAVCHRASSRRPGSSGFRKLSLNPYKETSSPPIFQSWIVKSPISPGRLNSTAACSIREMQLWISGTTSQTPAVDLITRVTQSFPGALHTNAMANIFDCCIENGSCSEHLIKFRLWWNFIQKINKNSLEHMI